METSTPLNSVALSIAHQSTAQPSPSPAPSSAPPRTPSRAPSWSVTPAPAPISQSRWQRWSDEMELALIEAFVTAVERGWRADSGYKADAWVYAVQEKDWKVWVDLTNQSGFEMGPDGVVCGDQGALEAYFAAYKDA
ncbi:hypothetical protein GQ44DRAFT_826697 [Phaeosphaeriaceae sp. PMI808]|nr:hypothetical protein GQ44DRAFT_826697 [Phaeosphaeriaceae sp. PMI808]